MLSREGIKRLIPHQGAMCLLKSIEHWDGEGLSAWADSHRDLSNPLRESGRLGVLAGVEYAAQAVAVHGALLSSGTAAQGGYLASIRSLEWTSSYLDDFSNDLAIVVTRLMGDDRSLMYRFELSHAQAQVLTGRLGIMLISAVL